MIKFPLNQVTLMFIFMFIIETTQLKIQVLPVCCMLLLLSKKLVNSRIDACRLTD